MSPFAASCEACGRRLLLSGGDAAEDDAATGPCEACGGELPVEATYCRHCGHAVREWRVVPILLMALGFCLTASIVGAVVGIPMQLYALRLFRRSRDRSVVAG